MQRAADVTLVPTDDNLTPSYAGFGPKESRVSQRATSGMRPPHMSSCALERHL